jgi:biopolymer transport protein ExbD
MSTPASNVNNDPARLRVSITARLIAAVAYTIPAIGGATGSFLLMNLFQALRTSETAGVSTAMTGMKKASFPLTVSFYLAAAFAIAVIIVLVIRMVVRTATTSPPFWFYAVGGILCLIPAGLFWKAQLLVIEVLSPGSSIAGAGISGVANDLSRLLLMSIVAAPIVFIVLVVLSVVPFGSRAVQKWGSLIVTIVIAMVFVATAIAVPFLIDGPKRKNEMVGLPVNIRGAVSHPDVMRETSVVITLTADNKLYQRQSRDHSGGVEKTETAISNEDLPKTIKKGLENKTPDKLIVYFKCDANTSYKDVLQVFDAIRKADVDRVGLVVIGWKNLDDPYQITPLDFDLRLPPEVHQAVPARPNPLILLASLGNDGRLALNNEDMGSLSNTSALSDQLHEVFKDREGNGVFRDGTNEIEKTVFLKGSKSNKYVDFIKLVEAVKISGVDPVVIQIDDVYLPLGSSE